MRNLSNMALLAALLGGAQLVAKPFNTTGPAIVFTNDDVSGGFFFRVTCHLGMAHAQRPFAAYALKGNKHEPLGNPKMNELKVDGKGDASFIVLKEEIEEFNPSFIQINVSNDGDWSRNVVSRQPNPYHKHEQHEQH